MVPDCIFPVSRQTQAFRPRRPGLGRPQGVPSGRSPRCTRTVSRLQSGTRLKQVCLPLRCHGKWMSLSLAVYVNTQFTTLFLHLQKTYRQKSRAAPLMNGTPSGSSVASGGGGGGSTAGSSSGGQTASSKGPDEEKVKAILERTGYTLDVTTGQRKYGGPPPGWEGDAPGNGCEVRERGLYLKESAVSPRIHSISGILW